MEKKQVVMYKIWNIYGEIWLEMFALALIPTQFCCVICGELF